MTGAERNRVRKALRLALAARMIETPVTSAEWRAGGVRGAVVSRVPRKGSLRAIRRTETWDGTSEETDELVALMLDVMAEAEVTVR